MESEPDDVYTHFSRGSAREINASVANVERAAVQKLTSQSADVRNSAVAVANASTLEARESAIGVAAGDYIKIDDSTVVVLLAPRVSGNVKALITLPAAFAIGAGFFAARLLFRSVFGKAKD